MLNCLYHTINIRVFGSNQSIEMFINIFTEQKELKNPQENLAVRAAVLLKEEFHIKDGLFIELKKEIPIAAMIGVFEIVTSSNIFSNFCVILI